MPDPDPILEEIRTIRDAIAKASDDDLQKIAEAARSRQRESGRQSVRLSPKRIDSAKKAS
jgi:hypothetical protein